MFLTGEWKNLAVLTWPVDPERLLPLVPAGCELDLWEGHGFISLVGFTFKDLNIAGHTLKGYDDFAQINLRFYVKQKKGEIRVTGVMTATGPTRYWPWTPTMRRPYLHGRRPSGPGRPR